MVPIVDRDNPVLRKVAAEVPLADIGSRKIAGVIARMKEALSSQEDGVAIAAPQVDESLRIFVISGTAYARGKKKTKEPIEDIVCINPIITKLSKEKKSVPEGCLSVRYLYGNVVRSTKATIEAYNEKGLKFTLGGSGLLAQIFQHEVDHLDGILFTDKATDIEDAPPEAPKEIGRNDMPTSAEKM